MIIANDYAILKQNPSVPSYLNSKFCIPKCKYKLKKSPTTKAKPDSSEYSIAMTFADRFIETGHPNANR